MQVNLPVSAQAHGFRERGFNLMELVVIMVVVSITAALAFAGWRPADTNINFQTDGLARDLRHTQALAMTWNRPLQLSAAGSSYSVSCVTAGTAPCNASPVINPSTNLPYSVSLTNGVVFSAAASIQFDTMGRPRSGGSFTTTTVDFILNAGGGNTATATVTPLTGFVTVAY